MAINVTLSPSDITNKYPSSVILKLTDDEKTGVINTEVIQGCIDDAEMILKSFINIDVLEEDNTFYITAAEIKNWWRDLTLYSLGQRVISNSFANKYDLVEAQIKRRLSNENEPNEPLSSNSKSYIEEYGYGGYLWW